jgi:hypothetical protein
VAQEAAQSWHGRHIDTRSARHWCRGGYDCARSVHHGVMYLRINGARMHRYSVNLLKKVRAQVLLATRNPRHAPLEFLYAPSLCLFMHGFGDFWYASCSFTRRFGFNCVRKK